jgi:hypothetical protein
MNDHIKEHDLCKLCGQHPADRFAGTYCHRCFQQFDIESAHGECLVPQDHIWMKLREERIAHFTARAALELPLFEDVPGYLYVLPPHVEQSLVEATPPRRASTSVRLPRRYRFSSGRRNRPSDSADNR